MKNNAQENTLYLSSKCQLIEIRIDITNFLTKLIERYIIKSTSNCIYLREPGVTIRLCKHFTEYRVIKNTNIAMNGKSDKSFSKVNFGGLKI